MALVDVVPVVVDGAGAALYLDVISKHLIGTAS